MLRPGHYACLMLANRIALGKLQFPRRPYSLLAPTASEPILF